MAFGSSTKDQSNFKLLINNNAIIITWKLILILYL